MTKKRFITTEIAKNRIYDTHKNNIELLEFNGSHKMAQLKCNMCGHIWNAIIDSVWRGNGCPECNFKKLSEKYRLDFNYVKNYIEDNGCELLSTEYINVGIKLLVKFNCGHEGNISFECFKRGHRCQECGHKSAAAKERIQENVILNMMEENSFVFGGFPEGYKDRNSFITFTCRYGHKNKKKFLFFLRSQTCTECTKIKQQIGQIGSKGSNWQGGLVLIRDFIKNKIKEWKVKSMESCNYKCIFTGERFKDIHHLQSMNLILKEAISELNFETHELTGDYSDEEIFQLINKVKEVHDRYPLGVCLTRAIHKNFHNRYGYGDTTPEDFYDFQRKVKSGEIQL